MIQTCLLGDGSSDRVLGRVVEWAIRQARPGFPVADVLFERRRGSIEKAIFATRERHGPDLIIVHRDAETAPLRRRVEEIPEGPGIVPLVPVRMTEAWLLIDESAIRAAANNPNGSGSLGLPQPAQLEKEPDPKAVLHRALAQASGLDGPRRKKRFERDMSHHVQRVGDHIEDFASLRSLEAYRAFEDGLLEALDALDRKR